MSVAEALSTVLLGFDEVYRKGRAGGALSLSANKEAPDSDLQNNDII